MVTKTKMAGLIVAVMALSVPIVFADNGDVKSAPAGDSTHQAGDWHQGKEHHMMAQVLNLSEDQQKQLKESKEKQKAAMKAVFEQMKSNREAFDAEITKATPDMNKINDLQTQIKTIQSQMADSHLNALLEIKKIMTPEQFAGYMALEKEEKLTRHGHRDGFGKDGDEHKHEGGQD